MKINFSKDSKEFLLQQKSFIARDNPKTAKKYINNLVERIVKMLQYPNIGKINQIFNNPSVREIVINGFKIIYKIQVKTVTVLMIYKHIDFDEHSWM